MSKTFKMTMVLIAISTFVLSMSSCNSIKPIDPLKLEGYWDLKTMNGEEVSALFEGQKPSVRFSIKDSMISGNAGCNMYHGVFSLNSKNEFSAPTLGTTMRLCMHKHAEEDFLKNLSFEKLTLSLDKNEELAFSKNGKIVLEFIKGTEPAPGPFTSSVLTPENIAGKWVLKTLKEEDASVFGENIPFILFDAENSKFHGSAGCNTMRGGYKLEDSKLIIGPIMSTKMACPVLDKENALTEALQNELDGSIQDGELVLSKDGVTLLKFVKGDDTEE